VKDLVEIPDNVKNKLEIIPVKWIDKVLEVALERQPTPLPEAVADGAQPTAIYTSIFRSYVVPGGSGATLPLAIMFIRSKAARLRRVGWLGIWPGIFNINEPITFGAPIIFNPVLAIPFFKGWLVDLGWWWFPFAMLVVVGASNAVNLTDGLDGLAIGPIVMAGGAFAVLAYLTGNFRAADYLKILNVRGAGELPVLCAALIGAAVGFLWFNCHPAEVFMGDAGSLALGGAIGMLAVLTKAELLLPLIGGIYVVEAASVILQVTSFKLTGRRIFRMAPLHHHYELSGWPEPKIVVRFWIVSFALALLALTTLKLR